MLTVDEAFKKFKSRLEITGTEEQAASRRQQAIRSQVDGGLDCDVGEDTDGDGRPNLIIYPAWATVCGGPSGGDSK